MAAATIAVCALVIFTLGVALVVLARRPPRVVAPSVDETLSELRAATDELIEAATSASAAADRLERIPPPPSEE